jgi:hypothetical protein
VNAGELLLARLMPVGAIEVVPVSPAVPGFGPIDRLMTPAAKVVLDPAAQVLDQMKPVGHLACLRSAGARTFGVEAVAVAADDLDLGR